MIKVPTNPQDGDRVHYWRLDGRCEGLVEFRVTFITHKPCHEVTGCDVGSGVPYVNEWYVESRYVPSEPHWRGTGRTSTAMLRSTLGRRTARMVASQEAVYQTFENARLALLDVLDSQIAAKRREAQRLHLVRERFPAVWTALVVALALAGCGSCGSRSPASLDAASPGACCALAPDGSAVVACVCQTFGQGGIMDSCAGHPESTVCVLGVACGSAFYPGGCP